MRRHTSIDLDAALVDTVKRLFGHGALHRICTEALQIIVNRQTVPELLTPEERDQIAALRAELEQTHRQEVALRECWETHIKEAAGAVLLKKGATRRVIDSLSLEAGLWLQERQYPVPPAARIAAAFKKFSNEELPGWREAANKRHMQKLQGETSSGDEAKSP